jgi:Sulfotransferase domain
MASAARRREQYPTESLAFGPGKDLMTSDRVSGRCDPGSSPHVNFLIAGVQKAGTSSLYQLLKRHPAVGLSSVKEVHFFDDESIDWSKPAYDRYHSYFPNRRRAIAWGEATPIYSYWPNALERIKAYSPDIKLILLFRDPISRAYSAWSHQRRRGRETLSFAEAIRGDRHRGSKQPDYVKRHFSYVERGYYGEQLGRCLELFPRRQVLTLDCSDLSTDPSGLLERVTSFLGVPAPSRQAQVIQANARPQGHQEDLPSPADIELLVDLFASDLNRFAQLVEYSIANWPTLQLMHGQISAEDVARKFAPSGSVAAKQRRIIPVLYPALSSAAILTKRAAAVVRRYARRTMS